MIKRLIIVYIMWIVAVMSFAYCANIAPVGADGGWSSLELFSFLLGTANFSGGETILGIEYHQMRNICQKCQRQYIATYSNNQCQCDK